MTYMQEYIKSYLKLLLGETPYENNEKHYNDAVAWLDNEVEIIKICLKQFHYNYINYRELKEYKDLQSRFQYLVNIKNGAKSCKFSYKCYDGVRFHKCSFCEKDNIPNFVDNDYVYCPDCGEINFYPVEDIEKIMSIIITELP